MGLSSIFRHLALDQAVKERRTLDKWSARASRRLLDLHHCHCCQESLDHVNGLGSRRLDSCSHAEVDKRLKQVSRERVWWDSASSGRNFGKLISHFILLSGDVVELEAVKLVL
jgi:hypothetical protein